MNPPDRGWEIFEILLLHVLSNDAWQFTINLFSISWRPLENVTLLSFLLKMQIRSDCNALNIAGNCIKDINVNLSFLSLGSKVVEWTPLTQHENFWNSTFACTVQWCMTICHKPFFHQLRAIWKCGYTIFPIQKCRFEVTVMHLILPETAQKISM